MNYSKAGWKPCSKLYVTDTIRYSVVWSTFYLYPRPTKASILLVGHLKQKESEINQKANHKNKIQTAYFGADKAKLSVLKNSYYNAMLA